ncbi:MAG: hypothetical protein M4579_004541 [Chaenotheca gracillima]|nr:MAG: hypothetical protein M4579_004541 [Chaenotheca gracillima]
MEDPFGMGRSSGTPLYPISPERANQQRPPQLPTSPSLPELNENRNLLRGSDVQHKVAQFNSMNKDAADRRRIHEAALRRAVMGREEAESDNKRMKDELGEFRKEVADSKDRERRVAERLEALMEEVHRAKSTQAHTQAAYEKELRRVRKEAFKSSSALVKLQEELKATRNHLRLAQSDVEQQKSRVEVREHATFKAEYNLVELQQELDEMREQKRKVEEERDGLCASLKGEEIARIAAEGKIALPPSREADEFSSPVKTKKTKANTKKKRKSSIPYDFSIFYTDSEEDRDDELRMRKDLARLKRLLSFERSRYAEMEDMLEMRNVECQFKCCPCRTAEAEGEKYIYDHEYVRQQEEKQRLRHEDPEAYEVRMRKDEKEQRRRGLERLKERWHVEIPAERSDNGHDRQREVELPAKYGSRAVERDLSAVSSSLEAIKAKRKPVKTPAKHPQRRLSSGSCSDNFDDDPRESLKPRTAIPDSPSPTPLTRSLPSHMMDDDDTFSAIPFTTTMVPIPHPHPLPASPASSLLSFTPQPPKTAPASPSKRSLHVPPPAPTPPLAPTPPAMREPMYTTTTTTMRIPLTSASPDNRLAEGATMSREQALEQIRQRRGRARSIAADKLTPRKQTGEGALASRRDISAPGGVGSLASEPRRGRLVHR